MATAKEPERDGRESSALQTERIHLLLSSVPPGRTPGLRLWPFIVSARNGHTVPLIQQIQMAADSFLFGAPLFCILNGPKNWENALDLCVKDFDYEKADSTY
jgi:hypothetical protein